MIEGCPDEINGFFYATSIIRSLLAIEGQEYFDKCDILDQHNYGSIMSGEGGANLQIVYPSGQFQQIYHKVDVTILIGLYHS